MVALLLVLFVAVLLAVDLGRERRRRAAGALPAVAPTAPANLPAGVFVHPGHAWAEVLRSGHVRVGLDGLVSYLVGTIEQVTPRQVGEAVRQGEPLLRLEQGNRHLTVAAPVTGRVTFLNDRLISRPSDLGRSTYGDNWVCVLQPTRLGEEIPALRVAGAAADWLRQEFRRLADCLGDMVPAQAGMAMQDGGMPMPGALSALPDEAWARFQCEFLSSAPSAAEAGA
jgi:glycine cleavage system H protein